MRSLIERPKLSLLITSNAMMVDLVLSISTLTVLGCAAHRPAMVLPRVDGNFPVIARSAIPGDDPIDTKMLEKSLRELLIKNMPDPIVQSAPGWGRQKEGVVAVKYLREGAQLRTELVKGMRNDGMWRRVSIRAVDTERSLQIAITDLSFPEAGSFNFRSRIGVDCDLKFEQQLWRNGTRLYGGETRGRCHANAILKCELTSKLEKKPGSFFPEMIFRLKVSEAELIYDGLRIEHTAGLGGDVAKILGEAFFNTMKGVKPDLERSLLAKANAAIVKAADTKEIRLSFDAILKGGPVIERKK